MELKPQDGPQTQFHRSPADIVIYGGAAGGGKTFAILMEPLRHIHNPQFRAAIFRRTRPQIKSPSGLWDRSQTIYGAIPGAYGRSQSLRWTFPSGAEILLAQLEAERTLGDWGGAEMAYIGFDELTTFTERQFWFMLSRNRSRSGIKSYIRATCNPDPDSFVRKLVDWWIDNATGLPIPERSGKIRWFIRMNEELYWADTRRELREKYGAEYLEKFGEEMQPKSLTFIPATLNDNKELLEKDPSYRANLLALPKVDRERLLGGNWNVRATAGAYFKREYFEVVNAEPTGDIIAVRYWDRAASKPNAKNTDPDWTCGVKLVKDADGVLYVADVRRMREGPLEVKNAIIRTASQDGISVEIGWMQDPGSAGVSESQDLARALIGYNFRFATATGDKETRAKPVSAQAEAKNIRIVRGAWNDDFLRTLENFPDGAHDDDVDALSGAFDMIAGRRELMLI